MLRAMSHQRLISVWVARVDGKGCPRASLAIATVVAVILTYINLTGGGITVFNWLGQIATTGYFMVWVVIAVTSFCFRAALKAQNDPVFKQVYAWKCSFWPLPPIWLLICCSLYKGCSFYLALFPIVRTPIARSYLQH
jgi:amino acid transporter